MTTHVFPATVPLDVVIDNAGGDVLVRVGDGPEATVTATGERAEEAVVGLDGTTLSVRVPRPSIAGFLVESSMLDRTWRVDLTVTAPAGSSLDVKLRAGTVTADGPFDRVRVDTGAGAVRLTGAKGAIDIRSGAGDIEVDAVAAASRMRTGAGRIRVRHVHADTDVTSGTGEVELDEVAAPSRVKSGAGSVRAGVVSSDLLVESGVGGARVDRLAAGSFEFKGSMGDVTVGVVPGVPTWTELRTTIGRIRNRLPAVGEPAPGAEHLSVRVVTVGGTIELVPAV